jgi:hypothetical protein
MSFSFFLRHCDALDESDEAVSVAFWRNWRDLCAVIRETFEEVLNLLDGSVL